MTKPPIISLGMSVSPELSSCRTSELIIRSTRSGSHGRLRSALEIERASLSRSKGSRWPLFFITVNSRSWTRSKVVKRAPQFGQKRRRRIAPRSSVGRESFTWVSSAPQNGQRIYVPPRSSVAPMRGATLLLPPRELPALRVDRKTCAKLPDLRAHPGFCRAGIAGLRREPMQGLHDASPNGLKFILAEAARRCRRRAQTKAWGHGTRFRVERKPVLVAGDAGSLEVPLAVPAGNSHGSEIHQHQVRVGPAGDDLEPRLLKGGSKRFRVCHDRTRVLPERRLQSLVQRDRLGGDHMHQRTALQPGKDRSVDSPADLFVISED